MTTESKGHYERHEISKADVLAKSPDEVKFKVTFPVFDYCVNVIFTKSIANTLSKFTNAPIKPGAQAMHVAIGGRGISYIIFPMITGISAITHESYHAICRLMKWVGAEHEEEIFAYHLDYLVTNIQKNFNKKVLEAAIDKKKKK